MFQLFELLFVVIFLGGALGLAFAVLTAVAWGAIEASGAVHREVRKAFGWPPAPGWNPHAGGVALAGWVFAVSCQSLGLLLARSGSLPGVAAALHQGPLLGLFVSACGIAVLKRRPAGQPRRGEKWLVVLALLAWLPYFAVTVGLRD